MRRLLATLLIVLIGGSAAFAEDPTPEQEAADAFLEQLAKDDPEALKTFVAGLRADPWLIVDELLRRDADDAAASFAGAVPETPDHALMAAYVEAQKAEPRLEALDKAVREVPGHLRARDAKSALAQTEDLGTAFDIIPRIRLGHMRSVALQHAGKSAEGIKLALTVARAAAAIGWRSRAASMLQGFGGRAYSIGDPTTALQAWTELHALEKLRERKQRIAASLANMGLAQQALSRYEDARTSFETALEQFEAMGLDAYATQTRSNLGTVYQSLGDFTKALEMQERTLAEWQAQGNALAAARTLGNIANIHFLRGDYTKALKTNQDVLAQQKDVGDDAGVARTLGNIGLIQASLGSYTKALATYARAQRMHETLGNKGDLAGTLVNIGAAYAGVGEYAKALRVLEEALALANTIGHRQWAANAMGNIGAMYQDLGDHRRALASHERAFKQMSAMGDRVGATLARQNMGSVYLTLEEYEEALALFENALQTATEIGDQAQIATALGNIAQAQSALGRHDEAFATFERGIDAWDRLGGRVERARLRHRLGHAYMTVGKLDEAEKAMQQARRTARSVRSTPLLVTALVALAKLYLVKEEPGRALSWAREALTATEGMLGGLGEELGATARGRQADLFAAGALAAFRDEDVAEALTFLESGRAGALLDVLGNRELLRWKAEALPEALREADRAAQAAERARRQEHDLAVRGGKRREIRAALEALDAASARVREVADRIQRELKRSADLYYPRARTLEEVQERLAPHQALVLYGMCFQDAIALVLTPDDARMVRLGSVAQVQAAVEALDASNPEVDATAPLAALGKLLVKPLGLTDAVKQVLISPEGALCYVPFGAIFDRPVALTPSGTTHALLKEEMSQPGTSVLAIGDPDYAGVSEGARAMRFKGRPLVPLPGTRKEAETVGTHVLIADKATEAGLREALAKSERWRGVHLACHGLLDVERPILSSLALTRAKDGDDDGFLSVHEVLRMQIPTDLAVLSACETGTGEVVLGEGVMALMRAFMLAGAPRIVCSLWKVDDEATQALMIKFYALWNPKEGKGLGAAEALRKAQAHVRAQEKWKHPYYWAAWTLWGLPE